MPTIYQIEERPIPAEAIITVEDVMKTYLRHKGIIGRMLDAYEVVEPPHVTLRKILLGNNGKFSKQISIKANEDESICSFAFSEGFRVLYLAQAFREFKLQLDSFVEEVDFEKYLKSTFASEISELYEMAENEFGDYVVSCGCKEIVTFDDFIRDAKVDKTYYVGSIMHYEA